MESPQPNGAYSCNRPPRARRGWLRALDWGRAHARGLEWLARRIPFTWRLALRRRLHAASGTPMAPLPLAAARRAHLLAGPPISPGVNLLGYAHGEFGVAETMRICARALEPSRYPLGVLNLDPGAVARQADLSLDAHLSDTLRFATNVFFINANQMPIARSVLGRRAFADRHNIGYWLWELETFPADWRRAFDQVDEIWTPTAFVRDAIAAATTKPVSRMPLAVINNPPAGMDRSTFGLSPDAFVFLFSYDFNGFASRKNPEAVIAAFRRAFGDDVRGVRLLLKSVNGARFPERLASLKHGTGGDSRIEVRDGFLDRNAMRGLQNACDCFVSLHRAEGFGLGLAECMALGKPVIATGYSGNLDFMDHDNSLLVNFRMVPLRRGDYPYWQRQRWADPDIAHAAHLMRRVFDDRDYARRVGAAAAASIRQTHSLQVCGNAISTRLKEIDARHDPRPTTR